MIEYFGELENENKDYHFKVFSVMAENPEEAYEKLLEMIEKNKTGEYTSIYQISRKFEGIELPQPVYDFCNGFELYK